MKLIGKANRTTFVTNAVNGEKNLLGAGRNDYHDDWYGNAATWDVLPEDVRGAPVPSWEYNGRFVRIGKHSYLRSIGGGFAIRENTGELYQECEQVEALYAEEA